MVPAPQPENEADRLAALRSYEVLDTACEDSFDRIADLARRLTGTPMAFVSLIDAERQWMKAASGAPRGEAPRSIAFCAHAILDPDGATMVVPDAAADPRFADNPFVTQEPGLRFYAGVPLVNPEGHALGTLCIADVAPRGMTPEEDRALRSLAQMVVTTLELRRANLRMRSMALTDALTGIPNRVAVIGAIERAIHRGRRAGEAFSLLLLDLDGFKAINDRRGHAEGDAVLRAVAGTLTASLRREDEAGRLGGDEFAVVLARTDAAAAREIAERLRARLQARMQEDGWTTTASIGAVTFAVPPASAAAALAAADAALYAAKGDGRNRVAHRLAEVGQAA
jgi:diguanylate cyclase (GGDEF)-like protein